MGHRVEFERFKGFKGFEGFKKFEGVMGIQPFKLFELLKPLIYRNLLILILKRTGMLLGELSDEAISAPHRTPLICG